MIPFSGLLFFYLLFLGLLPAVVLGLLGKKLHYHGIFLCAAMLVIVFWQNGQLAALALFFLWEMALCCLFWRLPKRTRPLLWAAVILALGPLGLIKLGEVLQPFSLFRLMGASYMSFRAVQVLLDIYDGRLQKLRPVALGYFLLFFPAVSSGPIDRYRRFLSDLDRPPAGPGHLEAGWRLRERRSNQRLYPAVLACRPAGKRLWGHPLLYVRLHLLPLL
mgnify:CR=1 FL=1